MRLSIIVLNWNGRHHLEICLPALANQSVSPFEVVVVDNASSDDSVDYVRKQFPDVLLVVLPENRGFSGGNIAGLKVTTGEAVVLLNNDTLPAPDFVEQLERCASVHVDVGVIAAHLTDWEGRFSDSAGDGCKITGRGYARNRLGPTELAPISGYSFGACAGAALYRRDLIEDVGFLDEDFFLNFEDTDLSLRAQLRGWKIWFCREAVVRHRVSASQGHWSSINVYYGTRNHLWVCVKDLPGILLIKYLPMILVEIAALMMVALLRGRILDYVSGLWSAGIGLPKMLRKRRTIQRGRRISVRDFEEKLQWPKFSVGGAYRLLRNK